MTGVTTLLNLPLRAAEDLQGIARAVAVLPGLLTAIGALAEDVTAMRDELEAMRTELGGTPGDVRSLRADLDAVRTELAETPADVRSLRENLAETLETVAPMDDDLRAVERAVKEIPPKLDDVREHIDGLRSDLSGLPFVGKS